MFIDIFKELDPNGFGSLDGEFIVAVHLTKGRYGGRKDTGGERGIELGDCVLLHVKAGGWMGYRKGEEKIG